RHTRFSRDWSSDVCSSDLFVGGLAMSKYNYIKWFNEINKEDIPVVGGKGANLGELTQNGVDVPPGFCVTASAYRDFIKLSNLQRSEERRVGQESGEYRERV